MKPDTLNTPAEAAALAFWVSFWRRDGRPPTLAEAALHFDITPQAVSLRVRRLVRAGSLEAMDQTKAVRGRYRPSKAALMAKP